MPLPEHDIRNAIVVRGASIVAAPLLVTDSAKGIEFYDQDGTLFALLVRGVMEADTWGMSMRGDVDWDETLIRYGYRQPKGDLKQIIQGKAG